MVIDHKIAKAANFLHRAQKRLENADGGAGYTVQTIRIATNPIDPESLSDMDSVEINPCTDRNRMNHGPKAIPKATSKPIHKSATYQNSSLARRKLRYLTLL